MRILIAYPGPAHSTYDVAAGYEKALRSLGHDVYGYPYHKWLGFYHETLTHWASVNDGYTFSRPDVALHSSEHLVIAAVEFKPDVVLIVSGSMLHGHACELIHNLSIPAVLLLTESPYEDELQASIARGGHIAHTFTNERLSVAALAALGVEKPVTYLPHSFDPDVHRPTNENGYSCDVFFHGTMWPERKLLLDGLADLPFDVRLSGVALMHADESSVLVDNAELALCYNGAEICINHHRRFASRPGEYIPAQAAESIGPRAYEIAACGAFQLCDDTRPELVELFGHAVPTYADADDLRARIEYFMERPDERRELASLARERVHGCAFIDRAREFVEPVLRGL